jgi:hypothetical protein
LVTALMFLGGIHFFPFYVKCQLEEWKYDPSDANQILFLLGI